MVPIGINEGLITRVGPAQCTHNEEIRLANNHGISRVK